MERLARTQPSEADARQQRPRAVAVPVTLAAVVARNHLAGFVAGGREYRGGERWSVLPDSGRGCRKEMDYDALTLAVVVARNLRGRIRKSISFNLAM